MEETSGKRAILNNVIRTNHVILSLFLGLFFVYAGVKKFIPKPPSKISVEDVQALEENRFERPLTFKMGVKALRVSNFMLMVGVLEVLAGMLVVIPHTRLIGLLLLLPLTVNIFCFHFFMDNRPDENMETGLLLILNMLLILLYQGQLRRLMIYKKVRVW